MKHVINLLRRLVSRNYQPIVVSDDNVPDDINWSDLLGFDASVVYTK